MSEIPPIELAPLNRGKPPRLPGTVVYRDEPDSLIDALLADLYIHASNCVRTFGDFHLAVSPDAALEPAIRRLMFDPGYREFPWQRARLWLSEELDVPPEDARRRGPALTGLLADPSGIPPEQVHLLDPSSELSVQQFERTLQEHLGWREKGQDRLDFVLLSLGPQGEVAGYEAGASLGDEDRLAQRWEGDRSPARAAMTMRLINAARVVAVFACGSASHGPLAALAAGTRSVVARSLRPIGGDLRWYVDAAACPAGA